MNSRNMILRARSLLHSLRIDGFLPLSDFLHVGHCGVLLSLENRVDFLQRPAFGLDPIDDLHRVGCKYRYIGRDEAGSCTEETSCPLTMSPRMTTSHEALTMYIFHPMFCNPMGMMKTKTSLVMYNVSPYASCRRGWAKAT